MSFIYGSLRRFSAALCAVERMGLSENPQPTANFFNVREFKCNNVSLSHRGDLFFRLLDIVQATLRKCSRNSELCFMYACLAPATPLTEI
ncbi:hypothetical protein DPEC_G00345630 [Dallia pectoralis]|uniref:Uncharacterized protein n=1 Tax=Dallia pectoralis TaxID=75939 RepID=A0ACC2F3K0_DALPE|nr:hypothetical protein DPEC_G00345630 [Dallia pectoralis]